MSPFVASPPHASAGKCLIRQFSRARCCPRWRAAVHAISTGSGTSQVCSLTQKISFTLKSSEPSLLVRTRAEGLSTRITASVLIGGGGDPSFSFWQAVMVCLPAAEI